MLLAIDTSAGTSVAVVDGATGIAVERSVDDTMRHAEVIGALVRDCLHEAGVEPGDLDAVVAGMGPGPFTGLRVGIAAARVFAFARGIPLLPVISSAAIAFDHYSGVSAGEDGGMNGGRVLVVTDARRRELYWSVFDAPGATGVPALVDGPGLATPADVPQHADGTARIDAARVSAAALGRLAERMRAAGAAFPADQALYLRTPDVTPAKGPKRVTA
ncbi:tRNA (adenosine(37)-N6)-threonylcarbamoyltransferase complex dimerization subunit type 1 TsaB [Microbacteriaceae bacterium 4G12]